jgi:hypothetical protein
MNRGAVAIVDALGFRGIWGDVAKPSTAVLASLRSIGSAAQKEIGHCSRFLERKSFPDEITKLLKDPFMKVIQLSDTIVVAAGRTQRRRKPWQRHTKAWLEKYNLSAEELEDAVDAWLRYLVCRSVCAILKAAALCDPSLIYRGVVTVGKFAIDETFLLGPAVDEAAELMDLADGPFVWLSPTANRLRHVIHEVQDDPWDNIAVRFRVPLKGGRSLRTHVLNPFVFCSKEERRSVERRIMARLESTKIDVLVKKDNARDLVEAIRKKERLAELAKRSREDRKANTSPT